MLKDGPAIRLQDQLVFQLEAESLIGPVEHAHGGTEGAGVKPALAIGLVKQALHDSQTPLDGSPSRGGLNGAHADPRKDQRVNQCLTLDRTSLNPAFKNQAQFARRIHRHGLMKVMDTSHALEVGKTGKSFINQDRTEPSCPCFVHPKPDVIHGLKSPISDTELANLQMTIALGIYEV